ncbi:thiolproteinase SmTP1, putative [Perkinsus marinus ATCC 50983]|uniref:Thiolproteinase SmTP1, putative n=2 Tax=Perkinsus marinus (strain ATCC 50983 / TXsc) TaxID=423536 RepID=C5KYU7_PERM5|nr:thiolproteinase SmTP1, putative [Perkinsus marinus ATCC 50983]EER10345.1 thiolproteinase SmTP1, putative [Perkinsus marinus ATCC 50983]|eukprot:XP_002778550.1 thiolproteinase SmTP1, putative [Perkinsus marinus ATCC 50983]
MLTPILLSSILGVFSEQTPLEVQNLFEAYKDEYDHDFGEEDANRLAIFHDNLKFIDEVNSRNLSYKLGITPFTHLTNDEFREFVTRGYSLGDWQQTMLRGIDSEAQTFGFEGSVDDDLPMRVDYVEKGWVTDVKFQGTVCGSCWAFGVAGALEGLHKNVTGQLVSLSEQELIDCSRAYGNNGCNGTRHLNDSYEYVADHGLETERAYKYVGKDGQCRRDVCEYAIKAGTISHVNVKSNSSSSMLAAVAFGGPVSAVSCAWAGVFQNYKSGIIKGGECGNLPSHVVLVVGYDRGHDPYYRIKNSWGVQWGEHGYARLAIDDTDYGVCGILYEPVYPISK